MLICILSTRQSTSAKGNAVLNDPNDPTKPGELIVNFGGFARKYFISSYLT